MAFSYDIKSIINYAPELLNTFRVVMYEWIDNLYFTLSPTEYLENGDDFINVARKLFLEAGWDGDGEIELMWIPPFMFKGARTPEFCIGIVIWHVKQKDDGISWILTPIELPCETEFQ